MRSPVKWNGSYSSNVSSVVTIWPYGTSPSHHQRHNATSTVFSQNYDMRLVAEVQQVPQLASNTY